MARGNRREAIFHDDDDRRFFLKAVGEACARTGWLVHAWVLMGNHYHLFIQTPEPNLVAGMSWLQNTYTRRYNVRHRAWGRLFGDRYKAVVVEGDERQYYQVLMDYIHLNPVRARIIQPQAGQSVLDYAWSSLAGGYALPPGKRARWLAATDGLTAFGLADTVTGRRRMVERLDRRAVQEEAKSCGVPLLSDEADARCSHLRRGWYWGTQAFAEKLRELAAAVLRSDKRPRSRAYKHAEQARAHGMAEAERYVREGLVVAGLGEGQLAELKGSDPRKVALAGLLWRKTVASQEWIAEKLQMRSATNVSKQLRRWEKKKDKLKLLPPDLESYLRLNNSNELSK